MIKSMFALTSACLLVLCIVAAPALGITIGMSSTEGGQAASSTHSFDLDRSAGMQLQSTLDSGRVFSQLQAEGEGNNHLSQTVSGSSYALTTDVDSQGALSLDRILVCLG